MHPVWQPCAAQVRTSRASKQGRLIKGSLLPAGKPGGLVSSTTFWHLARRQKLSCTPEVHRGSCIKVDPVSRETLRVRPKGWSVHSDVDRMHVSLEWKPCPAGREH